MVSVQTLARNMLNDGGIDNTDFLRQEAERMRVERQQRQEEEANQVRYALPNIKLPSAHKSAFSSKALFAQQQDISKHDHGLQTVLLAIHNIAQRLSGVRCDLPLMEFTVNFSGAGSRDFKKFSVRFTFPFEGAFELEQRIGTDMIVKWFATWQGTVYRFDQDIGLEPVGTDMAPIDGREARVIDFD